MKTNWDKITETPESLAEFLDNFEDKTYCDYCAYCSSTGFAQKCKSQNCHAGLVEWLKQPLPMSEQFSDEDIEKAQELKQDGWNWVARGKDDKRCNVYEHKPFRTFDDMYGNYWQNKGYSKEVKQEYFKFIKWEDEPILLDDIINSREEKQ